MAAIHFLNVKEGDCSVIEHNSGRVTVIDGCNAKPPEPIAEARLTTLAKADRGITGDPQQEFYPVNPVSHMPDRGLVYPLRNGGAGAAGKAAIRSVAPGATLALPPQRSP